MILLLVLLGGSVTVQSNFVGLTPGQGVTRAELAENERERQRLGCSARQDEVLKRIPDPTYCPIAILLSHRPLAALIAISFRCSAVRTAARA